MDATTFICKWADMDLTTQQPPQELIDDLRDVLRAPRIAGSTGGSQLLLRFDDDNPLEEGSVERRREGGSQADLTSKAGAPKLAGQSRYTRYHEFPEVRMPQLLIRDIPDELNDWIDEQSHGLRTSKKEFVLSILSEAWKNEQQPVATSEIEPKSVLAHSSLVPFTFIDLFAGIGGFRIGLERVGGKCVFTSEWDKYAQKTYKSWFGDLPEGDIRDIDPADIPDHDVLAAGFPCQPFSIAGVSKKASLGREHGFRDVTQGTLFFHLAAIIEAKRPPVFVLENVKNLKSHDRGQTWRVISDTLTNLGYHVHSSVIDAASWVPQHRERVFIVGFDQQVFGQSGPPFAFPDPPQGTPPKFSDILDPRTPAKYTLTDHLWNYLQGYAAKHKAKGNGFGFGMTDLNGVSRTLSARYYKDGSEILIPQGKGRNPRRLSPREAARLMGFPDHLDIVVSDTQAYKQFGNSVSPPVVEAVGRQLVKSIGDHLMTRANGCLLKRPVRHKSSMARNR